MGLTKIKAKQISNLDFKQAARVVTVTDVTLTGGAPAVVDGVSLLTNDRVLVTGQTDKRENGIYRVQILGTGADGTWIRTTDADVTGEVLPGMIIMVTEGVVYADRPWKLTTNGVIIIGATELDFELFNGGTPGGANTNIQFNDSGTFGGSANLTWLGDELRVVGLANIAGNVTADYFTGNGSLLTGISTSTSEIFNGDSNVSIDTANADITMSVAGVSNVVVVSTSGITVAGNVTGNGIPTTTVSNTAPMDPEQGDIWIDSDTAVQLIYFSDGNSSQWAEMEAQVSISSGTGGNIDLSAVDQNITPAANVTYDLGTASNRWRDIYLAGNTIYLGSVEISADSGNLLLPDVIQIGNTVLDASSGNLQFPELIQAQTIVVSGNVSAGNVNTTGNISAGNIVTQELVRSPLIVTNVILSDDSSLVEIQDGLTVTGDIVTQGNVSADTVTSTNLAGTITTASQPNITAVGTLSSLTVTGNVSAGNVLSTNITGTIATASQPNITSVGTLTSLDVTGNVTAGNITGTITTASQPNITSVGTLGNLSVTGNVSAGNVSATNITGTIATASQPNITGLGTLASLDVTGNVTAGNITGTNITGTIATATQPMITSVGTLGNLSVTGNISAGNLSVSGIESVGTLTINNDATIVGNLTVQGNTITANVTSLVISDPIINLGRGANNTPLISNDGLDRGVEMFYYTTEEQIAFMGYDNNEGKMILASNVSVSNNVITVNGFGTTQLGILEAATATVTGNISAGNVSGTNITGTIATASQPNITGLGTLGSLSVTGNITAGNVSGTNITGTITTASQPNITGLGTLGSLSVTGNVGGGNLNTAGAVVVTGTGAATSTTTGSLRTAGGLGVAGNIYAGGLLSVTGNITAGNLALTTALPVSSGGTGITAFGTGVATFLGSPTSANLAAAVTDETGSGSLVFGTNPTISGATISGGSINNTPIGATTRNAGNFTTLDANGNVTLGDATSDTITATGRFNTDLVPSTDNARDLGTSALKWKQIYATTFTENGFPLVSQTDIGSAPNQIPLNQYLGDLAYQNANNVTAINKVTITAPATSATLTIADGKTLTANNSITLAGTDATTMTFPTTSANIARTDAAQTFTGDQTVAGNVTLNAQGDLRFADSDSSNWVAFQAPATVSSNVTWTLPAADGTSGQVLSTNGSGTLSWATGGGGGGGVSATVTQITATGGQTTFNVTYTVNQLSVYLNGALLAAADYTATNGTTVVLAAGAAANDIFTAVAYNSATQIIQGDTKVEVTDTGSNGKVTGTADNTAVFSVEKGKTFVLEGGSSSTGVGIAFPATQVASTNANTLDDYEEGSWTPVLSRTGSSYTFSFQSGRYTKIGNIVTCTFSTNISAIGTQGSGLNQISGFPFTPANLESGTLRWTGSFSLKAVLTTATSFYWSGAFFFTDGSNALQTNFTTGDMFGVITYQV